MAGQQVRTAPSAGFAKREGADEKPLPQLRQGFSHAQRPVLRKARSAQKRYFSFLTLLTRR